MTNQARATSSPACLRTRPTPRVARHHASAASRSARSIAGSRAPRSRRVERPVPRRLGEIRRARARGAGVGELSPPRISSRARRARSSAVSHSAVAQSGWTHHATSAQRPSARRRAHDQSSRGECTSGRRCARKASPVGSRQTAKSGAPSSRAERRSSTFVPRTIDARHESTGVARRNGATRASSAHRPSRQRFGSTRPPRRRGGRIVVRTEPRELAPLREQPAARRRPALRRDPRDRVGALGGGFGRPLPTGEIGLAMARAPTATTATSSRARAAASTRVSACSAAFASRYALHGSVPAVMRASRARAQRAR